MKQQLHHKLLVIAAAGMAALPLAQSKALAHQVQTNYILNGLSNSIANPAADQVQAAQPRTGASIELRSEFSNGEPLKGATVMVYAPNRPGRIWAKGVTDSEGRYDFKPDETIQGDWEVRIGQGGHADILTVPVSDRGIEADLMAQESVDLHYAEASPWAIAGSFAVAVACVGFARMNGKREAK